MGMASSRRNGLLLPLLLTVGAACVLAEKASSLSLEQLDEKLQVTSPIPRAAAFLGLTWLAALFSCPGTRSR